MNKKSRNPQPAPEASPATPAAMTRFKELWRTNLSEEQKQEFVSWCSSRLSAAQVRARVEDRYGITLQFDSQITGEQGLHAWCLQELRNTAEAEWAATEEQVLAAAGLTGATLRTELLNRITRRALVQGDHKLGLAALDRDLKTQQLALAREKFEFDAVRLCRERLPELQAVESDAQLSGPEKDAAVRRILFPS